MNADRFHDITARYPQLRIAVVGDFCLDRYLEIDPAKKEISIETGLPVHNVVNVRSQPGGAGTIVNNLSALGVGTIHAVGFAGEDGEGYELIRALKSVRGVNMDHFIQTSDRRTFTYTKPLIVSSGRAPKELNRLDLKNWSRTPNHIQEQIGKSLLILNSQVDAIIMMDQVDIPETGVATSHVLDLAACLDLCRLNVLTFADSRRGLKGWAAMCFKMNRAEHSLLIENSNDLDLESLKQTVRDLALKQERECFVTLADQGIIGAARDGTVEYVPAIPVRGEIDVVGAGDAITANLVAALASKAGLRESLEIANAAASIVIHQLGTTGTADVEAIRRLLIP